MNNEVAFTARHENYATVTRGFLQVGKGHDGPPSDSMECMI